MSIHEQHPDDILFAGDWHGYASQAQNVLIHASENDIHHVIQVGDFGMWRGNNTEKYLKRLQATCERFDIQLYFVDGTRHIRKNIHHLPRGFRWEWDGIRYLAMGGAYSVDRKWRELGTSYFLEEEIGNDDFKALYASSLKAGSSQVDVLVTHDSPHLAPNPITDNPRKQEEGIRAFGAEAIAAAGEHRKVLQLVTELVNPVLIVHGHYHAHGQGRYTQPIGTLTDVVSLDEGSVSHNRMWKHTLHVTLSDLHILKDDNRASE